MNDARFRSPPAAAPEPLPGRRTSRWFWPWFWRIFLVVSLGYAWYCFYVPSNGIAWAADFASAQEQATQSGKPIVVFFTAKWCVPCRIMKRTVWADEQVEATVNDGFIPVMIYLDDPDAVVTSRRYRIGTPPTTIITDAQGNVLERVEGRMNRLDFLTLLASRVHPPSGLP